MAKGKGKNTPGFFKSVTGALDDVFKEIKADVNSMTPPDEMSLEELRKARESAQEKARVAAVLGQSSAGLAENTVELPEPEAEEFEEETPGGAPVKARPNLAMPVGNLWKALKNPETTQRLHGDVCYHAHTVADIELYFTAVSKQKQAPFTLGILAVNISAATGEDGEGAAADADMLPTVALKTVEVEPRIYGALGAGPRALWDDQQALDDQLCIYLNENPKLIALGPIGLDQPFAPYTLSLQQQQLSLQLDIAAEFDLPVLLTNRGSHGPLNDLLSARSSLPRLIYYDALTTQADADLVTRFKMSVLLRPELTVPSQPMAEAYRSLPQEKLLLGCGSALVAPQGFSGHFNEPKFMQNTLEAAAKMLGMKSHELLALTNTNFSNLFPQASAAG